MAEADGWEEYFSAEDMQTCMKVLNAMRDNRLSPRVSRDFVDIFKLMSCLVMPSKEERKLDKQKRKKRKREEDLTALRSTVMRAKKEGTIKRDRRMLELAGAPDTKLLTWVDAEDSAQRPHDQEDEEEVSLEPDAKRPKKLNFQRSCHVCHARFKELHHFYDQMCGECAQFNFDKRNQTIDMTGRVSLVTGGRVKIGFEVALKLLRSGSETIVTTRFPKDAASRFAKEDDFNEWKGRLKIYGLDFRDIAAVHAFCDHLKETLDHLDVLINNAAQTVRKPPKFYEHLLPVEQSSLSGGLEDVVVPFDGSARGLLTSASATPSSAVTKPFGDEVATSVALSQVSVIPTDKVDPSLFPEHELDVDAQQIDMRTENSWVQPMDKISTSEMMECHLINAFAPFVLNSQLKSLLMRSPMEDRYIVNVSAMEGQFYRMKSAFHAHSNMAKASLNMMTRTAAADYAKSHIYMTAVDTGWITDENPLGQHTARMAAPPPLDQVDAALRILDPVFSGINDPNNRLYGVFLKDYKPTRW